MTPTLAAIADTPIAQVKLRPTVSVGPDTALGEVVARLLEGDRGAVLVRDDTGILGIFTERDVMLRIDHGDPGWPTRPVREVMTPAPTTVRAEQTIDDSLNLMLTGDHRHLPLVDADGGTLGIMSIRDILVHIVGFFPQDFLNLPPDPEHETSGRWGG